MPGKFQYDDEIIKVLSQFDSILLKSDKIGNIILSVSNERQGPFYITRLS